ncbi:glycerate kinase [soil metagenome]
MRILVAPDKFKHSLSALHVAEAIRDGFLTVFPAAEIELAPIADGGEGTAEIFRKVLDGEQINIPSHDALGRPITASYTWISAQKLAVIEMSAASGLWRLKPEERNALQASTSGTGELMRDAASRGATKILVGLGGSATNDAGCGMAGALGWQFLDGNGQTIALVPENFLRVARIVPPSQPLPSEVIALCDVTNPLLGPEGATNVYGPQKGADAAALATLELSLAHIATLCCEQLSTDFAKTPGTGAAGGIGFGLMTFCEGKIERGADAIFELLNLEEKIAAADLVITAEGKLDAQTLHGKGPMEVARQAKAQGKPVIAFAGKVEAESPEIDACIPIANGPLTLEESQQNAAQLLRAAAARTASLLKISL